LDEAITDIYGPIGKLQHSAGDHLAMVETRIAPRFRVDKQAVAEYGGDKYPCVVRDISSSGAAIEFPDFLGV
jgi:hypothetical protein